MLRLNAFLAQHTVQAQPTRKRALGFDRYGFWSSTHARCHPSMNGRSRAFSRWSPCSSPGQIVEENGRPGRFYSTARPPFGVVPPPLFCGHKSNHNFSGWLGLYCACQKTGQVLSKSCVAIQQWQPLLNAFTYNLRQNFLFGWHISSATTAPPCWRPFPFQGGPLAENVAHTVNTNSRKSHQ